MPTNVSLASLDLLQEWQETISPGNPKDFSKRLEWQQLSTNQALYALQVDGSEQPSPAWLPMLIVLQRILQESADVPSIPYAPYSERENYPFEDLWWPICSFAERTLVNSLPSYARPASDVLRDMGLSLLKRLSHISKSALWEMYCGFRSPGMLLLAHLTTETKPAAYPREIYQKFICIQQRSGLLLLLDKYPVLGRLISTLVSDWLKYSGELLLAVANDWPKLKETFSIPDGYQLTKVRHNISDPHNHGRSVSILTFEGFAEKKDIVYKPKNLGIALAFQDFLKRLNSRTILSSMRCLKILPCNGYGYMEWVEHCPCNTNKELAKFYYNAGRLMAILQLLGCTDCHNENFVASGEEFVLIDLETLLAPDIVDTSSIDESQVGLRNRLEDSVLSLGILPDYFNSDTSSCSLADSSALGISPPLTDMLLQDGWLAINSDGMIWGKIEQRIPLPHCLPVGYAQKNPINFFRVELCDGFQEQMKEFIRLKPDFSASVSILGVFRGTMRRLVVRPTRIYSVILNQALSASALCSFSTHGIKLDQLSRSYLTSKKKPIDWRFLELELLQMERLDIPFFEHLVDDDEISFPDETKPISGIISCNGLAASQIRILNLDQAEIDFQIGLIQATLSYLD